jgi:hypothetical protein
MSAFKDRTGQKFGRLTVICLCPKSSLRDFWTCRCDCGNKINLHTRLLLQEIPKAVGACAKKRQACEHLRTTCQVRVFIELGKI